jgi:gluconate:H+ symporter, GntP family
VCNTRIGVLLAFNTSRWWKRDAISRLLHDPVEKAGGILVIIGAGGAFGAVLQATKRSFCSTLA